MIEGERYLIGHEVMDKLRISARSLQNYRDTGVIPFTRIGNKILYLESKLLAIIDRNYIPADEPIA